MYMYILIHNAMYIEMHVHVHVHNDVHNTCTCTLYTVKSGGLLKLACNYGKFDVLSCTY